MVALADTPTRRGAPTSELGQVYNTGPEPWATFIDLVEDVSELTWPLSVRVYEQMRNDSQIDGLLQGFTAPITRYDWRLDRNGAPDAQARKLAADLGVQLVGDKDTKRPRTRGRFTLRKHMPEAFDALLFGHMPFEQVGKIDADGLWHLRKLLLVHPRTIGQMTVASDGGLISVKQLVGMNAPEIPLSRMVWYAWQMEQGQWQGRSALRSLYRNWICKDLLVRIDVMNSERAGVGLPVIEAAPGATPAELKALARMASDMRGGAKTGLSVPAGSKVSLVGITGTQPRTLESIQYHDEQMSKRFQMMVRELGLTKTGSRALGSTFLDVLTAAQVAAAEWFQDVFNEHVIEDWWDWNVDPAADTCPQLVFTLPDDEALGAQELAQLFTSGAIVLDDDLANEIRDRFGLPPVMEGATATKPKRQTANPDDPANPTDTPTPPAVPAGGATTEDGQATDAPAGGSSSETAASRGRGVAAGAADGAPLLLPSRPLRRQPYPQEVAASVDFATMDATMTTETDLAVAAWAGVSAEHRRHLRDAIIAADGDVEKLAALEAPVLGAHIVQTHATRAANAGATAVVGEAQRQGVTIPPPSLDAVTKSLTRRSDAVASLLARSIGEAAARKALQVTAKGQEPTTVAQAVEDHLAGLSDRYLRDQLGGTVATAMLDGRRAAFAAGPEATFYASELLDSNTCTNCVDIDGKTYPDLEAADDDYPTGGYRDCLGGPRCRGTIVAVYAESAAEDADLAVAAEREGRRS